MMCHPGNVRFRGLVESKHLDHSLADCRDAKVEVTRSVMRQVLEAGGRFLVWNKSGGWTQINNEKQIYAKIAVFFRNSKITVRAKTHRQSTMSSTYAFAGNGESRSADSFMTTVEEPGTDNGYITAVKPFSEGCINVKRQKVALPFFSAI